MTTRWGGVDGASYDEKWTRMADAGIDPHGEVAFVQRFNPQTVLDAGCGTGRVAIELAARGVEVVGVDADAAMIETARQKAPTLEWVTADLSDFALGPDSDRSNSRKPCRLFDVAVLAGNVMIFVAPGTETSVFECVAGHLAPGGRMICGFQLNRGWEVTDHHQAAAAVGLEVESVHATWDGDPWTPSDSYVVTVHRMPPEAAR